MEQPGQPMQQEPQGPVTPALTQAELTLIASKWKRAINMYEKEYTRWEDRGSKVVDRYLDKRTIDTGLSTGDGSRFNILWSNVQTIKPACYAKMPKVEVGRRFKDKDPVGRVASIMLERCVQYENEQYSDFSSAMESCVEDRLLPGRGVAWIRYEPSIVPVEVGEKEVEDDKAVSGQITTGQVSEDVPDYALESECTKVDYIFWKDFGHTNARRWEEVKGVWRRVYLDKNDVQQRFANCAKQFGYELSEIPYDQVPDGERNDTEHKQACIYEIWDKTKKRVVWMTKNVTVPLDVRDDPLKLDGFFPCPKPLYATLSTGKLVPVPDYCMYQDHARELDILTERIGKLQLALKVVGVYDATQKGVQRMLNEGVINTLIPVDTWAAFAEKGGIAGVVDFMPLDQVVAALQAAYEARETVKQTIYEITGISDIARGATDPNETLGAQQLKSQWGSLRIRSLQSDIARFGRDLIRLRAEVICNLFDDQTIVEMSGATSLQPEDQQLIPQALQLLRNDILRDFMIDIETDSMVEVDEQAEKEGAVQFLEATGGFLEKAIQAPPDLVPLLAEMLMFGMRRFKAGRTLEGVFDETLEKLKQPKPPAPNPEMLKVQGQQQIEQAKLQGAQALENQKLQAENQRAEQEGAREVQRIQTESLARERELRMEGMLEQQRNAMEDERAKNQAMLDATLQRFEAMLKAKTAIEVAEISAGATLDAAQITAAKQGAE